jgi:nucleotide-binding universal stress UspA family protein
MQRSDQIVMEPKLLEPSTDGETIGGTLKSILFNVHDDDALEARLQAALTLARACGAHLQLLHVVPIDAYNALDTYGGTYISGQIVEALEEQSGRLRADIEDRLTKEDVSWSYTSVTSFIVAELLQNAALSDLVIIGRKPHWHEFSRTGPGLIGEIVCHIRSPICIPGDRCDRFDPFGKAIVAWNGSFEAANAVRSTIGLLKMASEVRVIRYTEDKETVLPDTRVLEYLSRHNVHAEIETHLPRTDVATDLIEHAARIGAQYVTMGGYGHSRAGEFLFGGVTRELIGQCPVSLVMAH